MCDLPLVSAEIWLNWGGGATLSCRHNGTNLVFHPSLDLLHKCPFWKYIYHPVTDFSCLLKITSFLKILILFNIQLPTDGQASQHTGPSRVAAVGPYIQSSTMPRGQVRQDALVKPAYPDGTATLPAHDPRSHSGTGEYVQSYNTGVHWAAISSVPIVATGIFKLNRTIDQITNKDYILGNFSLLFVVYVVRQLMTCSYSFNQCPAAGTEESQAPDCCDVTLSSEGTELPSGWCAVVFHCWASTPQSFFLP